MLDGGQKQPQGGDGVCHEVQQRMVWSFCRVSEALIKSFSFSFVLSLFSLFFLLLFFCTNGVVFIRESPVSGCFQLDDRLLAPRDSRTEAQEVSEEFVNARTSTAGKPADHATKSS